MESVKNIKMKNQVLLIKKILKLFAECWYGGMIEKQKFGGANIFKQKDDVVNHKTRNRTNGYFALLSTWIKLLLQYQKRF